MGRLPTGSGQFENSLLEQGGRAVEVAPGRM